MTENQTESREQLVPPGSPSGGTGVPRLFGVVMLAEAATLGIASYLHRDGRIPLGFTVIRGEHFTSASIPEAVIGAVLAAGAVTVLTAPARARRAAVYTTCFGIVGFLLGTYFVLTSGRPSIAIDLTYHATALTVLVATLVMLELRRSRPRAGMPHPASGPAPGNRVRQ